MIHAFCKTEKETCVTYFECTEVKALWNKLTDWIYPNMVVVEELSIRQVLFGVHNNEEGCAMFNFLLLITKRYIYIYRYVYSI